jgi:hypothetical protein
MADDPTPRNFTQVREIFDRYTPTATARAAAARSDTRWSPQPDDQAPNAQAALHALHESVETLLGSRRGHGTA